MSKPSYTQALARLCNKKYQKTSKTPWDSESNVMKVAQCLLPGLVLLKHQNYIWRRQVWVSGSHSFGSCNCNIQAERVICTCTLVGQPHLELGSVRGVEGGSILRKISWKVSRVRNQSGECLRNYFMGSTSEITWTVNLDKKRMEEIKKPNV